MVLPALTLTSKEWNGNDMQTHFCSLYYHADRDADQSVPPDEYYLVRFPYGGKESSDRENMHALVDSAGAEHPYPDAASGLIRPKHDSTADRPLVGHLWATCQWDDGDFTELRGQFSRDPLGANDTTGTQHQRATPGIQCFTYNIPIEINSKTPLGFRVSHNASRSRKIVHAKFKLVYYTP